MKETLHLELLGGLHIALGGVPLAAFHSNKAPALLAYLAVTGRPHLRTALAALLWSDLPEEDARRNLRVVLTSLRQRLASHLIVTRTSVAFDRSRPYCLDVEQFEAALRDVALRNSGHLRAVVELYRGDFLHGFYVREAPLFDEWVTGQRERLRQLACHALHDLVCHHLTRREYAAGIDACTRLLALDPWREETHRHLMELLSCSGQRSAALAQYAICRRVLGAELGVEPSRETTALYQRILVEAAADEETPRPEGATGHAPDRKEALEYTLPAPATSLVGRAAELVQIGAYLVTPGCRLLTLLGPGGVGKTRLALEGAVQQQDIFEDGVYFIELAPIRDPALLPATIAQALRLRETSNQPALEGLKAWLSDRRVLLVLDNFEHLLAAAPLVSDLLASCPRLKVLTTSRAALHLRGEQEFPVLPLPVPDPRLPSLDAPDHAVTLTRYAAVELFVARAANVAPHLVITQEHLPVIAEICHRLDGLPLAIELAAARVKLFSPAALLARLQAEGTHRLALLTDGPRDLPVRQQTLRATLDWSYSLLGAREQTLFRRLAVFASSCTLEAAEAVCATDGVAAQEVVDGITALVDQSLLRQVEATVPDGDAEPRFGMLETIREYALEHLAASGEMEAIRQRHAAYFLHLVETAEPHLMSADQAVWLDRLAGELDNLRAVMLWSRTAAGNADVGARLASAMRPFWVWRGSWTEARTWLADVLSREGVSAGARAKALGAAAMLTVFQGDDASAVPLLEESLALYRALRDPRGTAWTLFLLGRTAHDLGDSVRAQALEEESLALFRDTGEQAGQVWTLVTLGEVLLDQGAVAQALHYLDEALAVSQQLGDTQSQAWTLHYLGRVAQVEGDTGRAQALYDESLAGFRSGRNPDGIARSLLMLGWVASEEGAMARAQTLYGESLAVFRELGNRRGMVGCLLALAGVAAATGQPEQSARLFGAAEALREGKGILLPATYRAASEQALAAVRTQLDAARFETTWAAGHAMALEQVIAEALGQRLERQA